MSTESYYKEIIKKFNDLTRREYASLSLAGIQVALIGTITLFLTFTLLEMAGNFSVNFRTGLFFVFLVASIAMLGYLFLYPFARFLNLFSKPDYYESARKVGKHFPFIKDDLLNAMQLLTIKDGRQEFYSGSMTDAAFRQIYLRTESVKFEDAVNFNKAKRLLKFTILSFLAGAILMLAVPSVSSAAYRLLHFSTPFIPPAKFILTILPGNAEVTRGEDVKIKVRAEGKRPENVDLSIKYAEQAEYEVKRLQPDSLGNYYFEIPAVRSSFKYFVKAEDVTSEEFNVTVVDKPVIRTMDLTVIPPSYSGQPLVVQKDNGNVASLTGSQMQFEITSTKELRKAELQFNDTTVFKLQTDGRNARGTYRIKKNQDYKIVLTDAGGNTNDNPVTYSIKAMPDAFPSIEIISPNRNVTLGEEDRIPLLLKISDDFGFSRLLIKYRISSSRYVQVKEEFHQTEIPINKRQKESEVDYIWNLFPLNLSAGDVVTYYLEVFDNDYASGPKSAKSPFFTVRVPSFNELFAQADNTQDQAQDKLEETLKEAEKLKEDMQKISQDLKQDKREITYQEKEKIEKALDKFEQMAEKAREVKKEMAQMQNDLQQNNMLSKETLEKYMELQELFDKLSSDEMKKAMEKMNQMLQDLNRNQIQQAMENMKFDEEQFRKSVERTLNLLKRTQVEQKMDEIMKRTEALTKKAEEMQKETQKSNLNDQNQKQELSEKQDEISRELKDMEQQMKDLKDRMNQFKDMPNDRMEKASEEFEKQQNEQLSEQAEQQISQGQKQQAEKNQGQIARNMKRMQSSMKDMQSQMRSQNQKQTFSTMMKMMENLLSLSKEQEALKEQTRKLDTNSPMFNEQARKQNNLQNSMDKLLNQMGELSKKSFAVSPEMGAALGKARGQMNQATKSLQGRHGNGAESQQGQAMASLNEAATLMKGAMESMMNSGSGSGGGMASFMQQLQKMSQQQMGLNNMTQQLGQGNLSMQQQAELQRLSAQQEVIRKSLEQLNKESRAAGQSKKIPANLENIVKEMQEVVTDMRSDKLDDDLIQKQERILSKLLDAQRSVNDRDYENERKANSGQTMARQSPADLNLNSPKAKDKIKEELMRAVNEGYARDYQELIRRYYEALQKENIRGGSR